MTTFVQIFNSLEERPLLYQGYLIASNHLPILLFPRSLLFIINRKQLASQQNLHLNRTHKQLASQQPQSSPTFQQSSEMQKYQTFERYWVSSYPKLCLGKLILTLGVACGVVNLRMGSECDQGCRLMPDQFSCLPIFFRRLIFSFLSQLLIFKILQPYEVFDIFYFLAGISCQFKDLLRSTMLAFFTVNNWHFESFYPYLFVMRSALLLFFLNKIQSFDCSVFFCQQSLITDSVLLCILTSLIVSLLACSSDKLTINVLFLTFAANSCAECVE